LVERCHVVGTRAGRKISEDGQCSDKKRGVPTQILGQTISKTAAHDLHPSRSLPALIFLRRQR